MASKINNLDRGRARYEPAKPLFDDSANRFEYFLIAWETDPTLLCHKLVVDPDGEFARVSAHRLNFDVQFFFE